ncbi:thiamine phosphate synthase [Pseudomonas tremae]|nr:thiamine phosphate synthase [Pseudomonas tremae]MCQ2992486.1 thiamine phosphate synthase [Pseudomonas tremae]
MQDPRTRLSESRLYLCTDARRERGDLADFADAALAGGVDVIQLRDKGSPGERQFGPLEALDELAACEILADAARRHGALFAVNDRATSPARPEPTCCTSASATCPWTSPGTTSDPAP